MSDRTPAADAATALGLARPPALIAIVGGGGKSSLMFALGRSLPGRVVMTTTTRIFAAQMSLVDEVCSLADERWEERLAASGASMLVVGGVEGERAVGVPPELPAQLLARADVDWVVAEADGSRMRPVKAPAEHEPVIPDQTDVLVAVVGIDALAGPIRDVAHRPELVSEVTGLAPDETLSEDALAALLGSPRGALQKAPETARVAVLINKVESATELAAARRVAQRVLANPRIERVAIGALRQPSGKWEAWSR